MLASSRALSRAASRTVGERLLAPDVAFGSAPRSNEHQLARKWSGAVMIETKRGQLGVSRGAR